MAKRSDTIKTEISAEAAKKIVPPPHIKLREQDLPFWQAITAVRFNWTDVDLAHAANLARCQADIEENQRLLDKEGSVLENARGTPVMNPRFTVLEQLSRRSVSLSSKIQVHAAATIGEVENNKNKNAAKIRAGQAFDDNQEEDALISRPN